MIVLCKWDWSNVESEGETTMVVAAQIGKCVCGQPKYLSDAREPREEARCLNPDCPMNIWAGVSRDAASKIVANDVVACDACGAAYTRNAAEALDGNCGRCGASLVVPIVRRTDHATPGMFRNPEQF